MMPGDRTPIDLVLLLWILGTVAKWIAIVATALGVLWILLRLLFG